MKEGFIFAAGLLVGAAASGVATYFIVNKKANDRADEEILSVKEAFKNRKPLDISKIKEELKEEVIQETKAKANLNKPALMAYTSLAKEYKSEEADIPAKEPEKEIEEEEEEIDTSLEYIRPEDYGEKVDDGFRSIELYWYADDILATENHEKIDDPELDDIKTRAAKKRLKNSPDDGKE